MIVKGRHPRVKRTVCRTIFCTELLNVAPIGVEAVDRHRGRVYSYKQLMVVVNEGVREDAQLLLELLHFRLIGRHYSP